MQPARKGVSMGEVAMWRGVPGWEVGGLGSFLESTVDDAQSIHMKVMHSGTGQCAVGDELVLLYEIAGESWSVLPAIRLGEETDLLVVWLVGRESAAC